MISKEKQVFPQNCLNLTRGSRCGIIHYPDSDSPAFHDLNEYDKKDAKENRCGLCEPGSTSCKPIYTKSFRESMRISGLGGI